MKKTLFFTILIYLTIAFGSNSTIIIAGTSIGRKIEIIEDSLTNPNKSLSDTINLELKSGEKLVIPAVPNNLTKVVMVKEKSNFDFLIYLLPILTLLLGIGIKELMDKWSDNKKIEKSGKRWIAELRSLEEPINKQIESLKTFIKEHEKEDFKSPNLSIYSSLDGEVFKSLDKNDLIKYIALKNRKLEFKDVVKISNKTNGYISVIFYLNETLKIKFTDFLDGTSKHIDSFTHNLQSLIMAFVDYGLLIEKEIEEDPKNDPRYRPILDLFSEHIMPKMQTGEFNPFELIKLFFIPLVQELSHLRLDERTRTLSVLVSSCFNDIKGIRMENKYISENISNITERYEIQLKDLVSVVNDLDNTLSTTNTKKNAG